MQTRPRLSLRTVAFAAALTGFAATTAGVTIAAGSAPEGPVSGEIQAFLVTEGASGAEQLSVADVAEPGQVMEFRIAFTNAGDDAVSGIRVVDPIPDNTRFIAESHAADVPAAFEVSIDGGESFEAEPVTRIETRADGTQQEVVVPPSQYTHVRWVADEALPGEGGRHEFSYRVAVN